MKMDSYSPTVAASAGVILYELYVGQPPFYTNSIYSLINHIVKDPVKYPTDISKDFKTFLQGTATFHEFITLSVRDELTIDDCSVRMTIIQSAVHHSRGSRSSLHVDALIGLLQKNPAKRLNWPHLLEHPFVRETEADRDLQRLEKSHFLQCGGFGGPRERLEVIMVRSYCLPSPR